MAVATRKRWNVLHQQKLPKVGRTGRHRGSKLETSNPWLNLEEFCGQESSDNGVESSIPTKANLLRRSMIPSSEALCPLCSKEVEDEQHLLFHCQIASRIWQTIYEWIGISTTPRLSIRRITFFNMHIYVQVTKMRNWA
ncbi:hypothetical protein ACS0TY_003821 [Phlomoides rotata]